MKHTLRIILFVAVGAVAAGCNKPNQDSKAQNDDLETAAATREKAITATNEAATSIENYAYAQKAEFVDAAERELSDFQAEMERLRTKIDQSTGEARDEAQAKLEAVSRKWTAAKAQLDEAKSASAASWEDVQSRYRTAKTDLKSSLDETRQWLSKRIEP